MSSIVPQINDWENVLELVNRLPKNFCILQAKSGFFGSLVYRSIIGSSDNFVWKPEFCGCAESLGPLEWPHKTEGYNIYELNNNKTYDWFKENHLATAHISHKLIEYCTLEEIIQHLDRKKILLLKTHNMDIHEKFLSKIIRIVGKTSEITDPKQSTFRKHRHKVFEEVSKENIHNLNIERFMNDDFDVFCDEYIILCRFLDLNSNINNVRQYILLLKEKIKRYEKTL